MPSLTTFPQVSRAAVLVLLRLLIAIILRISVAQLSVTGILGMESAVENVSALGSSAYIIINRHMIVNMFDV